MKDEPNTATIRIAGNGKTATALRTAEGKTKRVWWTNTVIIESKDDITAGDGARRHVIEGKGALATETTANCFELLERAGIPTHFVERISPTSFRALDCLMLPIEVVTRRIVTGSYSQRHPHMYEGITFLNEPNVEFFLKDDVHHDPLLVRDDATGDWLTYDAHLPLAEGPHDRCWWSDRLHEVRMNVNGPRAAEMQAIARRVFLALEAAWARQGVALVDLKIEFGFARATNELVVADVIDNDSWRIWPDRDKSKMLDKQVYRDLAAVTPEDLARIRDNYARVAEATGRFLGPEVSKATVLVRPKPEVLDPQGEAVRRALEKLGFAGVRGVRIGKLIEIELDTTGSRQELAARLAKMADELLANPVIEDYEVKV